MCRYLKKKKTSVWDFLFYFFKWLKIATPVFLGLCGDLPVEPGASICPPTDTPTPRAKEDCSCSVRLPYHAPRLSTSLIICGKSIARHFPHPHASPPSTRQPCKLRTSAFFCAFTEDAVYIKPKSIRNIFKAVAGFDLSQSKPSVSSEMASPKSPS